MNYALTEALLNQQAAKSDSVANDNKGIGTVEIYEENEKAVNAIFLATFAKHSLELDSTQKAALEYIASQCPLAGGLAVYQARAMLATMSEPLEYEDDSLCLQVGMVWRYAQQADSEQEKPFMVLVPNPSSGTFTILPSKQFSSKVEVGIYNLAGQCVYSDSFEADSKDYSFDLSNKADGIYFYHIKANQHYYQGKLILRK
jgi:Secretion system C-terminal sorting domain